MFDRTNAKQRMIPESGQAGSSLSNYSAVLSTPADLSLTGEVETAHSQLSMQRPERFV